MYNYYINSYCNCILTCILVKIAFDMFVNSGSNSVVSAPNGVILTKIEHSRSVETQCLD